MTDLREHTVQNAAIEWLEELGYTHQEGNTLQRDLKKVVLENDLRAFLKRTYPDLPAPALDEAMARFTQQESMDLDYRNRDFHRKLTRGISVSWKDSQGREYARHLYP
ncbi:MAG: type I restriction endonuclease subunit R, partial [Bacteroidetes bacterium]|nr:type I restriction endonuclease subunit R [Bacteroidota bacterium]